MSRIKLTDSELTHWTKLDGTAAVRAHILESVQYAELDLMTACRQSSDPDVRQAMAVFDERKRLVELMKGKKDDAEHGD